MKRQCSKQFKRRGAIAPMMALLLIPMTAAVAFAINLSYLTGTKAELQNAADAAALAGAEQLMNGFVQYALPQQSNQSGLVSSSQSSATSSAQRFASYNAAGPVSSLVLNNSDVQFGFRDSLGNFSFPPPAGTYPNTVNVTMRMDSTANGPLALFFGNALGVTSSSMTATASATIFTASAVQTFSSGSGSGSSGVKSPLLPVGLDINYWNQFLRNGVSPDGTVHSGPNGAPQIQVYPYPGSAPGNFGLVCIGPPATDCPTFQNWILNGPSASDLAYLTGNGLVPATPEAPQPWIGGPGMKSSLTVDFASSVGQPRLIPVFEPISTSPYQAAGAQGSSAFYNVVGFVGVTITEAQGEGFHTLIAVQPCAVLDPTAIFGSSSVTPATFSQNSGSSLVTTMAAPKLTQ